MIAIYCYNQVVVQCNIFQFHYSCVNYQQILPFNFSIVATSTHTQSLHFVILYNIFVCPYKMNVQLYSYTSWLMYKY